VNQQDRHRQWVKHRADSRIVVMRRANGRCEGCGNVPQEWGGLQFAHLFGRRHIVSEPMASDPDFCAALCHGCHTMIDGNRHPTLLLALRMNGIHRYAAAHGLTYNEHGDPLGIVREWEASQRSS